MKHPALKFFLQGALNHMGVIDSCDMWGGGKVQTFTPSVTSAVFGGKAFKNREKCV